MVDALLRTEWIVNSGMEQQKHLYSYIFQQEETYYHRRIKIKGKIAPKKYIELEADRQ